MIDPMLQTLISYVRLYFMPFCSPPNVSNPSLNENDRQKSIDWKRKFHIYKKKNQAIWIKGKNKKNHTIW